MSYSLFISEDAKKDIIEAYDWYNTISEKLAKSFEAELDSCFSKIILNPILFQKRHRNVRVCFTRRFPFGIHYVLIHREIKVIAVFHTSKNPRSWRFE